MDRAATAEAVENLRARRIFCEAFLKQAWEGGGTGPELGARRRPQSPQDVVPSDHRQQLVHRLGYRRAVSAMRTGCMIVRP